MDLGFSEGGGGGGGGANGSALWQGGRCHGSLILPCELMLVAKFILFLWHFHLFIAARFLLACVFRKLVILIRNK